MMVQWSPVAHRSAQALQLLPRVLASVDRASASVGESRMDVWSEEQAEQQAARKARCSRGSCIEGDRRDQVHTHDDSSRDRVSCCREHNTDASVVAAPSAPHRSPAGHLHSDTERTQEHRLVLVAAWTKLDIIPISLTDHQMDTARNLMGRRRRACSC